LIKLVDEMTEKSNVSSYKSNAKTFGDEEWRYCRRSTNDLERYKLDYRIVLARVGGISVNDYWHSRSEHGLCDRATTLLSDILTVATNIGFDCTTTFGPHSYHWESRTKNKFRYRDHNDKGSIVLMEVAAFKNQNMHIKFNQEFMCRLNIEFGRLKGWLKNSAHAQDELTISEDEAAHSFGSNLQLSNDCIALLPETVEVANDDHQQTANDEHDITGDAANQFTHLDEVSL